MHEESNHAVQAVQAFADYMEQDCPPPPESWQRKECCGTSRYLYCPNCYRLLVPKMDWPTAVQDGSCQLPFQLDILLEDNKAIATGVHVKCLLDAAWEMHNNQQQDDSEAISESNVKIFNSETRGLDAPPNESNSYPDGTYMLFPGPDSIPLSQLLQDDTVSVRKLVVLDCKWTRSSARLHPQLASLPKVSLCQPQIQSYFWRWHNEGAGMLCTVEAIYFAAWQITARMGWTLQERKARLLSLLWIFRYQRSLIQRKHANNQVQSVNPYPPYTEQAKEFARELRRKQKRGPVTKHKL